MLNTCPACAYSWHRLQLGIAARTSRRCAQRRQCRRCGAGVDNVGSKRTHAHTRTHTHTHTMSVDVAGRQFAGQLQSIYLFRLTRRPDGCA
eukprot:82247-Chlamydomonas_euryale.AAC.2